MLLLVSNALQAQLSTYLWARQGNSSSANASGRLVAPLPDGGCISSGSFTLGISFDTIAVFGSYDDAYVVMHDAKGNARWCRSIIGGSYDFVYGLSTTAEGNALLCGSFRSDSIRLDSITFHNRSALHNYDAFALLLDTNGNAVAGFKSDSCGSCAFTDIASDTAGNIYILGSYSDFISFDSTTLFATGSSPLFIVGYRPTGERFMLRRCTVKGSAGSFALAVAPDGRLAIAGLFFGDSLITHTDTLLNSNSGYSDGFVMVIDTSGNEHFTVHARGQGEDKINGVSFTPGGKLWLLAEASAGITIAGIQFGAGLAKAIWLCTDSLGNAVQYSKAEAWMIHPYSIAADDSGRVYVAGKFSGLNIQSGTFNLPGSGGSTAFWLVADTNGTTLEMKTIFNGDNVIADDICVNAQHDIFLTGGFIGHNDFVIGNDTLGSISMPGIHFDPFLVKIRGIGSTTGIANAEPLVGKIRLYPNPSGGDYIQLILPEQLKEGTIQIIDEQGRLVADIGRDENEFRQLNVSHLEAGLYYLIANSERYTATVKFVRIK